MLEGGHPTPLAAIWDMVYINGDLHTFLYQGPIFIKCKIEDSTILSSGLSCLYDSVTENKDTYHAMVRFVSMATLKAVMGPLLW